jgi:hypothetical protein
MNTYVSVCLVARRGWYKYGRVMYPQGKIQYVQGVSPATIHVSVRREVVDIRHVERKTLSYINNIIRLWNSAFDFTNIIQLR